MEREGLQTALVANIEPALGKAFVIADEKNLWEDSSRRVDLLCVDEDANLVVVELKRDDSGGTAELQAVRYAAMVSTMTLSDTADAHARYVRDRGEEITTDEAKSRIVSFLGWTDQAEEDDFNKRTRIVLISSNFSKELTSTVLWLNDAGVDIRCVRMVPYAHPAGLLIDVQQVIPVPEAADFQVRLRRQQKERTAARESTRDYSRYVWQGKTYPKNQLAHAIILDWVQNNQPATVQEVRSAFPVPSHRYMVEPLEHAERIEERDGRARHYKEENQLLRFSSGQVWAVSRGWQLNTITEFVAAARALGYEVEKVA